MLKEITTVNAPITENITEELTERPQWVCWRIEQRSSDDKPTKVPYTPGTERRASSTDLMTWTPFDEAVTAYEATEPDAPEYHGIGFVFSGADPFVGIDLDDCRDPETGEITEWAAKIIERVQDGYIEISPSGTGIHVIVEGTVRGNRSRKKVRVDEKVVGQVEMYGRDRFFTITGRAL